MNFEINKLLQDETIPFEFTLKNEDLKDIEGQIGEKGALVRGTIEKLSRVTFFVTLTMEMTMIYPCARCLEPTPVDCSYTHSETITVKEEEVILSLLSMVEECSYINEPYRILCSDDCAGLCPKCGNNLNHEQCSCDKNGDYDPRFEVLKNLL